MLKRKGSRRSSAQYYISAEEHVENEVKHERLLTETSRLSSSWASLSVSGNETVPIDDECTSNSAQHSPNYRSNSFSGPLVISVTCSSSSCSSLPGSCPNNGRATSTSPAPLPILSSGHASPVASPVSSRVQCYSPGLATVSSISSPTVRRNNNSCASGSASSTNCPINTGNGGASPLLVSAAMGRKRGYFLSMNSGGGSSDDASREGSPDPFPWSRASKSMRPSDLRSGSITSDLPHLFRWPPGSTQASNPPSPSCHLFSTGATGGTAPSSPSASSLPSPRLSLFCSTALPTCPLSPNSGVNASRSDSVVQPQQQQQPICGDSELSHSATDCAGQEHQSGADPTSDTSQLERAVEMCTEESDSGPLLQTQATDGDMVKSD